mmetsp:Transcript_11675/g.38759  ORF Transcript_11675/g.38759 Transcript_11675/m.38759 type:complete len:221 (-) Transcript_11675:907-1569(-)
MEVVSTTTSASSSAECFSPSPSRPSPAKMFRNDLASPELCQKSTRGFVFFFAVSFASSVLSNDGSIASRASQTSRNEGRSAGSGSVHFLVIAMTPAGNSVVSFSKLSKTTAPLSTPSAICVALNNNSFLCFRYGGTPATSSCRSTPKDQTSQERPYRRVEPLDRTTSGAMYKYVPVSPVQCGGRFFNLLFSSLVSSCSSSSSPTHLASPKSATTTVGTSA